MLSIDGSVGEGGGQALRTALSLSLVTRTPFRIEKIRARRARPGLMRQHLTAVRAAAVIGAAHVEGAAIGSQALTFTPTALAGGEHEFSVGTAGSTMLVLQTILPALLIATSASVVTIAGGTHNPLAPTFEFVERVYLPILARMGARVTATLERPGFYPAGGGRVRIEVTPGARLRSIQLLERGALVRKQATAMFASLPFDVARRELAVVMARLAWEEACCRPYEVKGSSGPGNVLQIELGFEHATELFTGFGERGVLAEHVADDAVRQAQAYLAADVPVGPHLADQLLLPMVLAGGGAFRSLALTPHFETQCEVLARFARASVSRTREGELAWRYEVSAPVRG